MTALAASSVAQLTAIVLGNQPKRSASKVETVHRFTKQAEIKGIAPEGIRAILAEADHDAAVAKLQAALEALKAPAAPTVEASATAPALTPGLRRLQAATDATQLAADANSEAARALADAAKRRAALEAAGPAPEAKQKPAKAPKEQKITVATAAKETSPRAKIETAATIVTVVANPKKAGSRSFQRFALYKAGATVQDFIDACVLAGFPAGEAKADLSWDRRKGFITVKAAA